jgi:hypothetical protein
MLSERVKTLTEITQGLNSANFCYKNKLIDREEFERIRSALLKELEANLS